jgi:hypothetical protein
MLLLPGWQVFQVASASAAAAGMCIKPSCPAAAAVAAAAAG